MTVKEAIVQVLKAEAKPLHTTAITDMILSRGLWQTSGKTPAATIEATYLLSQSRAVQLGTPISLRLKIEPHP